MEAVGVSVAPADAAVSEPLAPGLKGRGIPSLGHEDDTIGSKPELILQGGDFGEVGGRRYHEFEPGFVA